MILIDVFVYEWVECVCWGVGGVVFGDDVVVVIVDFVCLVEY